LTSLEHREDPTGFTVRVAPTAADVDPKRFHRRQRRTELSLAIGVPVALVAIWQVAFDLEFIDNRFYASPWEIVTSDELRKLEFWSEIWTSAQRMLKGFVLGSAAGIGLGVAMGVSRIVRASLESLLSALYTVPKLALIPLFVTLFGFGDLPRIILIAVTVFFFVWIATMSAVIGVDEGYREAAVSFGASNRQLFRHVLFPAALPQVFVGLRIAAGVAVLMLIGVELVLASDGLGALIEKGRTLFLPELTYVGIAMAALMGLIFSSVIRIIARKVVPWAPEEQTRGQA
jgi:sulfonate transport system permease protein|tara:strand:+ start:3335 stop:4198 length:864 start_codon:yes stop_codon:yes gene_type:complete